MLTDEQRKAAADRRREQNRQAQARFKGREAEVIAGEASDQPIPCPSAKALGTVQGVRTLQHRILSAVLAGKPGAAEKARVIAPYLRSLTELAKACEYEALHKALEELKKGNAAPLLAMDLDKM